MYIQVDTHICKHILIIYTRNMCPWGRVMWFEHSWLIRTCAICMCHLTTNTHTHTHRQMRKQNNKENLKLNCYCFPRGYSKVFTGSMTATVLCSFKLPVLLCGGVDVVCRLGRRTITGEGGNHSLQYVKGN